jgi:hypothetical protein
LGAWGHATVLLVEILAKFRRYKPQQLATSSCSVCCDMRLIRGCWGGLAVVVAGELPGQCFRLLLTLLGTADDQDARLDPVLMLPFGSILPV